MLSSLALVFYAFFNVFFIVFKLEEMQIHITQCGLYNRRGGVKI